MVNTSFDDIFEKIGEQENIVSKVAKIQSWIEHVTKMDFESENYPISGGLETQYTGGCSTVIETIFAKLRAQHHKKIRSK